jgi:hypothetical protein
MVFAPLHASYEPHANAEDGFRWYAFDRCPDFPQTASDSFRLRLQVTDATPL